jgi:hypothetical protein
LLDERPVGASLNRNLGSPTAPGAYVRRRIWRMATGGPRLPRGWRGPGWQADEPLVVGVRLRQRSAGVLSFASPLPPPYDTRGVHSYWLNARQ